MKLTRKTYLKLFVLGLLCGGLFYGYRFIVYYNKTEQAIYINGVEHPIPWPYLYRPSDERNNGGLIIKVNSLGFEDETFFGLFYYPRVSSEIELKVQELGMTYDCINGTLITYIDTTQSCSDTVISDAYIVADRIMITPYDEAEFTYELFNLVNRFVEADDLNNATELKRFNLATCEHFESLGYPKGSLFDVEMTNAQVR